LIVRILEAYVNEIADMLTESIASEVLTASNVMEFNAVSTRNLMISFAVHVFG
jgi:hypothetical protein